MGYLNGRLYSKGEQDTLVSFEYSPESVTKIKTISGHHWNSKTRYWTVPDTVENIDRLFELFKDEQVLIQDTNDAEKNDEEISLTPMVSC